MHGAKRSARNSKLSTRNPQILVKIKLFATLKERAGAAEIDLELPAAATVRELRAAISRQHPTLAELAARSVVSVNREFAFNEDTVQPADEVALFPPVSGGSVFASDAP